jgi:predicted transposase YdaD
MHEYDTVLKVLLQGSANSILEQITGVRVARWLNVELPEVRQTRVDLLDESADEKRALIHLELQSTNDPHLPLRMAEYSLRVYRRFLRFPQQVVLYVGDAEMRMPAMLSGPDHVCRYSIVDIRTLDSEPLLNSALPADNVIAILTRLRDRSAAIRRILSKIGTLETGPRDAAFAQLLILSGLRKLGDSVRTEVQAMPIMHDIMDHEIIGPAIKKGIQQGIQEGLQQGIQEGLQQGMQQEGRSILHRLIEKRFGPLPAWAEDRLTQLSVAELEDLSLRVIDAKAMDELFDR